MDITQPVEVEPTGNWLLLLSGLDVRGGALAPKKITCGGANANRLKGRGDWRGPACDEWRIALTFLRAGHLLDVPLLTGDGEVQEPKPTQHDCDS